MKKSIGSYPHVRVEVGGRGVVSRAGSLLLVETVRKTGLDQTISAALAPWRKRRAVHDPGKVLLDVALAVALGGDCLADVGLLRAERALFGPVASDPTVSRLISKLASGGQRVLAALRTARAEVRERVRQLADEAIAALELRHRQRPRTASAPPAPPDCAISPSTTPRRTGYGWRSSRSLSTCSPGCPCSH
ncbi:hypothetical protein GCM10009863_48020 [Streptomyces axinellae]|uniref:Transposase DDE domain-containing protein n=1 Tax=Streptomyces axinellae TaxID=552788 RepID=A0ABN3QIP1_9ACTN